MLTNTMKARARKTRCQNRKIRECGVLLEPCMAGEPDDRWNSNSQEEEDQEGDVFAFFFGTPAFAGVSGMFFFDGIVLYQREEDG